MDASGSTDPDNDKLNFHWWVYAEAGTFTEEIELTQTNGSNTTVIIPDNARGKSIHLILEVKDNNEIASMYDYRRIVFSVQ